jgi:hypothetical protein
MRWIRGALLIGGVVLVLVVLESWLLSRVENLVGGVQADRARWLAQGQPLHEWRIRVDDVEADVCNTLTGGLWFDFMLPRARNYELPTGLGLSHDGRRCRRHGDNVIFFYSDVDD